MSNLFLTTNAKFQPFTLDRYLQPIQAYDTAYKDVETKLGELAEKADVWDNMIDPNKEGDEAVYQQYKQYSDDVNAAADALASEGLRAMSRAKLLDLKRRYSKEIIPIEQAYAARAAEAKEQQAGRAQGMIYEGDAATSGLSRYMGNTQLRYKGADAKAGLTKVGAAAQALAKQLREYKITGHIDKYNKQLLQSYGISPENVSNVISNLEGYLKGTIDISQMDSASKNAIGALTTIVQNELGASGVDQWSNQDAIKQYRDYVATGLYGAIGGEQSQVIQDAEAQAALQDQYAAIRSNREFEKQKELLRLQKSDDGNPPTDGKNLILLNSSVDGKTTSSNTQSKPSIKYIEGKGWTNNALIEKGNNLQKTEKKLQRILSSFSQDKADAIKNAIKNAIDTNDIRPATELISEEYKNNERKRESASSTLTCYITALNQKKKEEKNLLKMIYDNQPILRGRPKKEQQEILNKLELLKQEENVRQDVTISLTPNKKTTTTSLAEAIDNTIFNHSGVKFTNSKGKSIEKKDINKEGLTLHVKNNKLYIQDTENNEYNVSGLKNIYDAENKANQLNTILRDFEHLPKPILMPQTKIEDMKHKIGSVSKPKIDKSSLSSVSGVTEYKQAIVSSKENTNLYKVITDNDGNVVSLYDLGTEINRRGATRLELAARPFADLVGGNVK